MSNKGRSLKHRSVYRKASEKAKLALILSDYVEENSVASNSNNIAKYLNSLPASTSTCTDIHNVQSIDRCNSPISACENEFSHSSDTEAFDEVVSNVSTLKYLSVNCNTNNGLNNNMYNVQVKHIILRIRKWAMLYNIEHSALNTLLMILKPDHPELPLDARTLLKTPRQINVKSVEPGIYYHFGLENCIKNLLSKSSNCLILNNIEILINIDGLPIAKSTSSQLYPILCSIFTTSNVDIVGIYHGNAKPSDANVFLTDLVNDINDITCNGIYYMSKLYSIKVKAFICDAPAKSFITYTKSHTGYFSCTKCYEPGVFINDRICFPNIHNLTLRCDSEFRHKYQESHHVGITILESILDFDMIQNFPLDYMHLICLGVVKKLLLFWVYGNARRKLSSNQLANISKLLLNLACDITIDFNRKPRSLNEVKRWKATEFRQFLLYTGPIVLKSIISHDRYINFPSLHVATFILCNSNYKKYLNYANSLMQYFVKTFIMLYGKDQVSYNVHNLLHICNDVARLGPLDQFSAFVFENYLQSIKKLLRKPEKPLQQIIRRKYESDNNSLLNENLSHSFPILKKQHNMGPIINNISFLAQYKEISLSKFILRIIEPDNCCCTVNNKIIILKNILSTTDGILLIAQEYLLLEDFYTKPCNSSLLGIYAAKNLQPPTLWRLDQICNKCVRFAFKDIHVIFPLLHSKD